MANLFHSYGVLIFKGTSHMTAEKERWDPSAARPRTAAKNFIAEKNEKRRKLEGVVRCCLTTKVISLNTIELVTTKS